MTSSRSRASRHTAVVVSIRRAFTLVELLVVIGIIALLISILLPSLNAARRQANTIKCAAAMRQIGYAFSMYSSDNKGVFPVVKWQSPIIDSMIMSYGGKIYTLAGGAGDGTDAWYWYNFVAKYMTTAQFGSCNVQQYTGLPPATQDQMNYMAGRSPMWGCPEWQGSHSSSTTWNAIETPYSSGKVSVYECGYSMNPYPFFSASFPAVTSTQDAASYTSDSIQKHNLAGDAVGQFGSICHHWPKQVEYTNAGDRALVMESTLWLFGFSPTGGSGVLQGMYPQFPSRILAGSGTGPGDMQYDLYRHGIKPKLDPGTGRYAVSSRRPAGKIGTNVLFADFHVTTVSDPRVAYQVIRMLPP